MISLVKRHTFNWKNDILSGLTVALALVPEAIAFAFIAGVDPLVGLHAAFMIGFITSIFGGRPGMISGATGALAVVMVSLVAQGNEKGLALDVPIESLGVQYLFLTVVLMGIIQMLAGVLKLGKFSRLIPKPVMLGFVNGLAIVIFLSQLGMFKVKEAGVSEWMSGNALMVMLLLIGATMAIMHFLPKLTTKVPSGLAAIVLVSLAVNFMGLDVSTVGSFIRDGGGTGLAGGLPEFQTEMWGLVPMNWDTLSFIFPYALILAGIGMVESLLTLNLIDELTETRTSSNRECFGLGLGNFLTGLFGGMGGCAMIGQSIINYDGGGRGRLSGLTASLALLAFILFGATYIELIPIAALTGIMFMVVIGTFAWSSLRILNKIPRSDAFVLIAVSGLTVMFDLAVAVLAGVVISALSFSWENAKRIRARKSTTEAGVKVYEIWGPLFFGSTKEFANKFTPAEDPEQVEVDMIESRVSDHSAVEALKSLVEKYEKAGKTLRFRHLSSDCIKVLEKNSPNFGKYVITDVDDPKYYVMSGDTTDAY